jgi:hypothetical protein
MAVVAVVLLAGVLLYYVIQPLLAQAVDGPDTRSSLREELAARKRAALVGILDIESERDAGKLSDEDFAALRREYETEAIAALRGLEAELPSADDDELEAEIAALRAELVCSECGATKRPGSRCTRCGAA